MKTVSAECCAKCRFWEARTSALGVCKRFPPMTLPDTDERPQALPVVGNQDWCGEFKRRVIVTA